MPQIALFIVLLFSERKVLHENGDEMQTTIVFPARKRNSREEKKKLERNVPPLWVKEEYI
jgi:hypothetical protein